MARSCRKQMRLLVAFAVCVTYLGAASAQIVSSKQQNILDSNDSTARREAPRTEPLQEAFRSVSLRLHPLDDEASGRNNIVIGFVGGFVNRNDLRNL